MKALYKLDDRGLCDRFLVNKPTPSFLCGLILKMTDTGTPAESPGRLFSFGIISDVQYADRSDGFNYLQTQRRYYRGALEGLRRAVASWVHHRASDAEDLGDKFFVLQLGDLLDGFNAPSGSEAALSLLLSEMEAAGSQAIHHCIGNHELYNFNRAQLIDKMECFRSKRRFYYSFSPHPW